MEQLRKDGWYINESQVSEFFDDGIIPKTNQEILKTILNEDLRHFAEASIINLHKKEESIFEGPCVLQLLRYRNVSVPRIKEELNQTDPSHSIIRLFFTDGHTAISAVVLQSIPGITSDTPPGTKVLITGTVPVEGNFLILDKKNVKILGGRVEEMIEKWNVEKSSVRADGFKSSVGKGTGAPKWVSFGKRGQKGQLEKGFKANSVMPKTQKEGDDADDFSKNRAEILKELETDTAKTFAKPNLAPPPVKAPPPPKERSEPKPSAPRPPRKGRGRKNSEDGPDVDVGEYANHKPSGPATLFDFIGGEEKEIVKAVTEMTSKMNVSENRDKRGGVGNNHPSSSGGNFKNPRAPGVSGSGRGGGRQGDRDQRPPRNDQKDSKNFSDRNSGGPSRNQQGPKRDQEKRDYGRQENRGPQQNQQSRQNRPNTGAPRGNAQNFQPGPAPRGKQPPSFSEGPPRGNQGFQQNQEHPPPRVNQSFQGPTHGNEQSNFQQGPSRGNQGFQQNQRMPRGNQGYQQHQGPPQHPRGNQFFQGPPNSNFQQSQGPRGDHRNQGFQQHQGPTRGNQNVQGPPRGNPRQASGQWHVGSQCLATWTDGNIYPATITDLLPDRTAVVRYNEYGNVHTIPVDFLIFP
ncbi:hypothetical protein CAEBREN_29273 [Caenorhabditis brenneri]|uniref:Survival of motor neuron-related-splicing factor 30 n=1 Tax=Caenorhabditis brenneri TaxID=135651 RepID=G0PLC2_CAEBE|nr:hypothetical protein CAEBREN_29273 [Caenorhabditis brenneri]